MPTLHIANKNYSSWSLRPWLLMTELGIPFDEAITPFDPGHDFHSFSPTGLVPCLVDGDIVVWESLAIVEYLAEQYPQVWPLDKVARTWARSSASEMHAGFNALRNECPMCCGIRVRLHDFTPALQKDVDRINTLWEEGLEKFGGPYLAGDSFTAVDAFFAPVCFRIQSYGLELGHAAGNYKDRILNLPSMQDWYKAGLNETWRDKPHDEEIKALGQITEDLRSSQE